MTSNIDLRIESHNLGISKKSFTKRASDWKVIHTEKYQIKQKALKREREIKSYKGGNAFKKLVSHNMSL